MTVFTRPGTELNVYSEWSDSKIKGLFISNVVKSISGAYKCITFRDGLMYTLTYNVEAYGMYKVMCIIYIIVFFFCFQFHALSRRVGRENLVLTLCSPLFAEFLKHCVLSGGIQRHTLP